MDGGSFAEDVLPDVLRIVGGEGGDEEGVGAEPGEDEIAVHAGPTVDGVRHHSVPVSGVFKVIETRLEGTLVLHLLKSAVSFLDESVHLGPEATVKVVPFAGPELILGRFHLFSPSGAGVESKNSSVGDSLLKAEWYVSKYSYIST